jgi:hypothetical protein
MMESPTCNSNSVLKNAYIDDFARLCVLHLHSDYDVQMQTDEFIWSFSTACTVVRLFAPYVNTSRKLISQDYSTSLVLSCGKRSINEI